MRADPSKYPPRTGECGFGGTPPWQQYRTDKRHSLPSGTLALNGSTDIDNGFRPAGLVSLSTAAYTLSDGLLLDYGATFGAGSATHHVTLYRATSGALVFSAGSARWPWALDARHDGEGFAPDVGIQQATINLLADMDVQPATVQAPLTAATKSADTTPPTPAISTPLPLRYGVTTTITGTAMDIGGGVVGAVEVSVDGGQTWHPAVGRENWTYDWTPLSVANSATLMVRASDDSGNFNRRRPSPLSSSRAVSRHLV